MTDKKLIVIGDGPDMKKKIKSKASSNIIIMGYQEDKILIDHMRRAKAFVFAAKEDFGIIPVEAQACGTPVICLSEGGTKETVLDGITGVHFHNQNKKDILEAIDNFEKKINDFNPFKIRKHALKFRTERFEKEIQQYIEAKYKDFKKKPINLSLIIFLYIYVMKRKVALIAGVTGQDGSYLSEFLLNKGYIVHGIKRRSSSFNTDRIEHLYQDPNIKDRNFILHYGDLTDSMSLTKIIQQVKPDEIYNLAAMSHVRVSFDIPEYVANTDALGTLRILEAIRLLGFFETKIYQASTSELFGKIKECPQNESTPFYPRSPYGVAKMYAYWITVNYREAYNIFACNGILFNHESPVRGETFVTRKITRAVSKIANGYDDSIVFRQFKCQKRLGSRKRLC